MVVEFGMDMTAIWRLSAMAEVVVWPCVVCLLVITAYFAQIIAYTAQLAYIISYLCNISYLRKIRDPRNSR